MSEPDDADMSLAEALEREPNSFNLVRLAAAVAVVVSHSCALLRGEVVGEPLSSVTPYTLGQHAVNVFFVLSGLMLSRSWSLRPHLRRFAVARLLRVYPGLAACGLLVAFVLAPLGTLDPGAYFSDPTTFAYPLRVLVQFSRAALDGVFPSGSLNPGSVNYSLWTIKYELAAYALFTAAAAVGVVGRPAFAATLLLLTSVAVVALQAWDAGEHAPALVPAGRFLISFAFGVAAFTFRRHVPLGFHCLAGFLALDVGLRHTPLAIPATIAITSYLALYLGSFSVARASAWARRNDLSYGIYLYAWPVQQLLLFRWGTMGLGVHVVASLAGASALAAFSWRFVESPALGLKGSPAHRGADGNARRAGPGRRPIADHWKRSTGHARWGHVSIGAVGAIVCAVAIVAASCCIGHVSVLRLALC